MTTTEQDRLHKRLDFRHTLEDVGSYRCSAFQQLKGWSGTFRVIPARPPAIEDLGVPDELKNVLSYHQGLIVVCGPSGHGKSTTLASLVDLINERKPVHVISLEDPIELAHPPKLALINQRQIGHHTQTYENALRASDRSFARERSSAVLGVKPWRIDVVTPSRSYTADAFLRAYPGPTSAEDLAMMNQVPAGGRYAAGVPVKRVVGKKLP